MTNAILCRRKPHFFVLVLVIVSYLKTWITSRLVYVLLVAKFGTENNRFELRFDTENNIKV